MTRPARYPDRVPLPFSETLPHWPERALLTAGDEEVVYGPDVIHLDGCADSIAHGGCGRRCLCECHDAPKPRRAISGSA